ncbi:MAG: 2-oxoacid:acceptor oxidoreductase family protein, partial [Thermodesulfobacteriota bacterium]|nr:2-oxoacid:acceptor oxidoreductase family protein [Thermodesulfobacteriota bacterium]
AVSCSSPQLNVLSNRIETDGLLIMEDDDLANGLERNDVKAIRVPGIKISSEIANPRVINTVYLGVYVGASQTVHFDLVKNELQQRFKKKEDILRINVQAFEEGFRFGEAA